MNTRTKTLTIFVSLLAGFFLALGARAAPMVSKARTEGETRVFPYTLAFEMRKFRLHEAFAAAPDAKHAALVVVTPSNRSLDAPPATRIPYIPYNVSGAHIEIIRVGDPAHTATPICGGKGNQWNPSWSPDGRHLAFYSDVDGKPQVWLMDIVGESCRRVSDVAIHASLYMGYQAIWSPDGRRLFVPLEPSPPSMSNGTEHLVDKAREQKAPTDATEPPAVLYSGSEEPSSLKTYGGKSGDNAAMMGWLNATLAAIDVDSGAVTPVVNARSESSPAELRLSPTGHWMSYVSVPQHKHELDRTYALDLSVVPSKGGTSRLLTHGVAPFEDPHSFQYRWDPTRDRLAYLKDGSAWLVDFSGDGPSAPRRLAPELGRLSDALLYFSRDGKSVAVELGAQENRHNRLGRLGVIPLDGGKASTYALPDPVRWQFLDVVGANDDILWQPRPAELSFLARDRVTDEEVVFRLDLNTSKTRILDAGLHHLSYFASGRDHRQLFAVYEDTKTPPDVYRYSDDMTSKTRLSVAEPRVEGLPTSTPVVLPVRVPLYDGRLKTIHPILLLPKGAKRGDKLPAIVMIYSGVDISTWATYYGGGMGNSVPNQIFTSRGFAVLMADVELAPQGEPSYPLQQMADVLLPQVYAAADAGYIDIDRLAVSGLSYGGYGTAAIVSQTNLFRAGIAVSGFYDMASLYATGTSGYGYNHWMRWAEQGQGRMGESLWANPQRYIENSPLYRIDRIHTPLMIVAGGADPIIEPRNARSFFFGLKRLGRPAELLVYRGADHDISYWSIKHATDVSQRMVEFLRKHLTARQEIH